MCKISSSGSPDPGQCASQDRSDQAPQRIVQNIVNLKVTQVIVQLGKFRRAAAEKSYDRTGDNTVTHRLTYKRKQISHRNVQQNVQEDFTGRRVMMSAVPLTRGLKCSTHNKTGSTATMSSTSTKIIRSSLENRIGT